MPRTIQPELLDSLPPHHPDALHNRRDLRLTNQLMGNHRWFVDTLPHLVRGSERVLELGAGTGELARRLLKRGLAVDGLDLWPRPETWPDSHGWHQADLKDFAGYSDYRVVIGNLIFHQFNEAELAVIGAALRPHVRIILACEPTRRRISQVFYRLFGPLMGVNHVSLHDAHVSIAAGFVDEELPRGLGLDAGEWAIRCVMTARGAYRLTAVRRA